MNYWDTSSLIKLYISESDSSYFLNLAKNSQSPLMSSDVSRQEILCTLYRKEQTKELKANAAQKLFAKFLADESKGRILIIPNGRDVVAESEHVVRQAYQNTSPIMLRNLDAIHVASALVAKATTVVATDKHLRDVAQLMGLDVLPE